MMGNRIWQCVKKEHATTREDGVSRARDDRLAFKARLWGCYD
jgi:hypothetical protein